ncbi:hypothetical protein BC835DRAFT_935720 [Cytidiella melzeri]|nr:hypothetical protein BC835DRAFT_935720 [Cytidiella melzeri]
MPVPSLVLYAQQLDNLRSASHVLHERVRVAIRTQVGDAQRLHPVREQALSLLRSAQEVSRVVAMYARLSDLSLYFHSMLICFHLPSMPRCNATSSSW